MTRAGEGDDEWVVSVKWSEAIVSCNGSVSQYVLCIANKECVTTAKTQYILNLISNKIYTLTIRADICNNRLRGIESDPESIFLKGISSFSLITYQLLAINGLCVFTDRTKNNTINATFGKGTGILESITLKYGQFSLEVSHHYYNTLVDCWLMGSDQTSIGYTIYTCSKCVVESRSSLTLGAHAQRGLR